MRQCLDISWATMNKGDSYVIDVPSANKVLIWRGRNSNRSLLPVITPGQV